MQCLRSTNKSNEVSASLASYSNHNVGSTTKFSMHIKSGIVPAPPYVGLTDGTYAGFLKVI